MSNIDVGIRLSPDLRREQILLVAAVHFSRENYEDISMQTIAIEAGITRALVYHYFPGKLALLAAILNREAELLLQLTEPTPALSAEQNIRNALEAYLDHFFSSRGQLRLLYAPDGHTSPLVNSLVAENHRI